MSKSKPVTKAVMVRRVSTWSSVMWHTLAELSDNTEIAILKPNSLKPGDTSVLIVIEKTPNLIAGT